LAGSAGRFSAGRSISSARSRLDIGGELIIGGYELKELADR